LSALVALVWRLVLAVTVVTAAYPAQAGVVNWLISPVLAGAAVRSAKLAGLVAQPEPVDQQIRLVEPVAMALAA
jgi:hypothetical protein